MSSSLALAQLATIAERRADRLVNPALSGLPPFLTRDSGLHSGYMMAQVTAAALVSELKTLAHPASTDTIPTSANREDHVSMSMAAALKAQRALELATRVVAIELLLACQAIDLLHPLTTSPALASVHEFVRAHVPTLDRDRPPSPDIECDCRCDRRGRTRTRVCHGSQVKNFCIFKLTTRAYVSRLLASLAVDCDDCARGAFRTLDP